MPFVKSSLLNETTRFGGGDRGVLGRTYQPGHLAATSLQDLPFYKPTSLQDLQTYKPTNLQKLQDLQTYKH